jgi:hypothetical protein
MPGVKLERLFLMIDGARIQCGFSVPAPKSKMIEHQQTVSWGGNRV